MPEDENYYGAEATCTKTTPLTTKCAEYAQGGLLGQPQCTSSLTPYRITYWPNCSQWNTKTGVIFHTGCDTTPRYTCSATQYPKSHFPYECFAQCSKTYPYGRL